MEQYTTKYDKVKSSISFNLLSSIKKININ